MKKILLLIIFLTLPGLARAQNPNMASQWSIDLTRSFSKDIFDLNGVPYLQPMVKAVNATSNARFFNSAYIPEDVDKPYFKISFNGMYGFVRDDMKSYSPSFPIEEFSPTKVSQYGQIDFVNGTVNIQDTAGLISYLFKTLLYDGVQQGKLNPPDESSTILGGQASNFKLDSAVLADLAKEHPVYPFLPDHMQDSVINVLGDLPNLFVFPDGANMNSIFAYIPQIEMGALWGTELLIRGIPPVDLGEEIGDFAFWGIALKHSISQYFDDFPFDLAIQGAYQGTHLENTIGVTNAELTSNATFWNANIHAGKKFDNIIEVYTGLSFEQINITADYKYYLPVTLQWQLGLVKLDTVRNELVADPENGYPGDTKPQTSVVTLSDFNIKFILGLAKTIGPVTIYVDYNYSEFSIFSFGVQARFSGLFNFEGDRRNYGENNRR